MKEHDSLRRFIFEHAAIRGELVSLDATWRAVLERHDYPPVIRDLLGEFMAAAALLASTVKYAGTLIMQVQGEGPVPLMVTECTSERTLRGIAQWQGDIAPGRLEELFGSNARLVITIDSVHHKERYQGITPMEGDNVAEAIQRYLMRSEQLDTHLWLTANENEAAGMLLQKMPGGVDKDLDAWNRAVQLADTIKDGELLDLPGDQILRRLFHEEDVRLFDPEPVSFRCSCSRDKVKNMLRSLGIDEIHSIIEEQGAVEVNCEYCNQLYQFDRVDAEELFASDVTPEVPPTKH